MKMIALAALAASAAGFAPAIAQTVPDPDPYYVPPRPQGPPPMQRRMAPPPGTSWQAPQGGMAGPPPMRMNGRMDGPEMRMDGQQMHMDGQQQGAQQFRMMQMRRMPMGQQGQMHHMQRGGRVPPGFTGQRFEVRDWRRFGFPAPFAGGRWIRFENDALLIDGEGQIFDSRPDWDWDGAGDGRMAEQDGGSRGGSWQEGAREVREGHGDGNVRTRVFVQRGPAPGYGGGYGPPPPPPGYGGGYAYGGYGGYGSMIVTETTVTEAPVVEQRTYVHTYVQRMRVVHRRHHVRCGCRPAHASYPGERG
jgi:Ni/Co efflux regulator RcnB